MNVAGTGTRVDVGIITIREDEFRAVLDVFPDAIDAVPEGRFYERRWLERSDGRRYVVAIVRAAEQGNTAAQAVANALLRDLAPRWVLVVGIAGGRPSDEFSLGDVVISTRIVDYSVGASLPGGVAEFAHGGGPLLPNAERVVTNLPAWDRMLGAWGATINRERPTRDGRAPRVVTGAILSSDILMRDPERLRAWLGSARQVLACEMESAGVYRATYEQGVPFVAIRGISDVVGVPRDPAWTDYAAASAAAFTRAFLRMGPIPLDAQEGAPRTSFRATPAHDSTVPLPEYPDNATRALCDKIARLRVRRQKLDQIGADITEIDLEILDLRRKLREGGQLRAGDALDNGRYLLIRRLGRGGFGVVWEAHDEQCGKSVAIKVLHGDLSGDVIRKERFFRGARIMAELGDEVLVPILNAHGEDGGFHYFVMALMTGGDLQQAVIEARITGDALLDVIDRVGSALARAHQKKLVHRDVKPANILLDARGVAFLADFDLVGGVNTTGGTRTGAMGSIIYAAPEQFHRPQDADARADVYGLGMAALFGLHRDELPMEVYRRPEAFIDALSCDAALKAVLRQAVDWNPAMRFPDAGAFCEALREARKSIPATTPGDVHDASLTQVSIVWRKKKLGPEPMHAKYASDTGAWLFFMDEGGTATAMSELLLARGETCVRVWAGTRFAKLEAGLYEIEPTNPEHYLRVLQEGFGREVQCRGIVHLVALDSTPWDKSTVETIEQDIGRGCSSAMYVVQAVLRQGWRDVPRLWLVTRGAQPALSSATPLCVSQWTLWGLGRTIALEHPELDSTLIDVDPARNADEASVLLREISSRDREDQVAYRKEGRFVARLVESSFEVGGPAQLANGRPFRLDSPVEAGVLDQLVLREITRRPPGRGEVEIQVEAAGLNFVDVMKAMGIYPGSPGDPPTLGLECAGRVVAVGEGVEKFSVGQEVVAFAVGSFGSHVTTVAEFVAPKPSRLSFAEAASVPVVFMTVYYALNKLARLGHNERVLIHTATGGTGLAAIQLARFLGAEVYATAGSEDKRSYLRSQGIEHVFDSRTLSFASEILEKTGGQGIDVVLNTLTGDVRTRSLELLAPYGRFVELSTRDIFENGQLAMTPFRRSVSFASVDLPGMSVERPALLGDLLNEVMQLFDMGVFQPLPVKIFPAFAVREAFEFMANAKHIGKVVVAMDDPSACILPAKQPRTAIRPDAAYLITGAVGGFELSLAKWMVEQGARHLALVLPSGRTPQSRVAIAAMEGKGAHVLVVEGDVANADDMARVMMTVERVLPPLRGVVHAAGILDDWTLVEMDEERLWRVLRPKVGGAFHLHRLTLDKQLDFFVLYSSSTSLLGAPGQGNYAAGNAFLDALAHVRQQAGLPGTSIHWGPFTDVCLTDAQDNQGKDMSHRGIGSLSAAQGLVAFGTLLERPRTEVGVLRPSVHQWIEAYPQRASSPFWSELQRD